MGKNPEDEAVPWTWPWEATVTHKVILTGYPLAKKLGDPARLNKADITKVVEAIRGGTCYFRKISEEEFVKLAREYDRGVAAGQITPHPPREDRSDKGSTRGRHENPVTRTKKRARGKVIKSKPIIPELSDVEEEAARRRG